MRSVPTSRRPPSRRGRLSGVGLRAARTGFVGRRVRRVAHRPAARADRADPDRRGWRSAPGRQVSGALAEGRVA